MKIERAVIAEQHLTINLTTADLLKMLPPKIRKMVESGATFEANVMVPGGGDWSNTRLAVGADVPIVLSVFQRSAPKVAGQ